MTDTAQPKYLYSPQDVQPQSKLTIGGCGLASALGAFCLVRLAQWPSGSSDWRVQAWVSAAAAAVGAGVAYHSPRRSLAAPIEAVQLTPASIDDKKHKFEAAMVLAGVGDALGYQRGRWEFDRMGNRIQADIQRVGGIEKINLSGMPCSDDTTMTWTLGVALLDDSIVQASAQQLLERLAPLCADNYLFCYRDHHGDGVSRAYGMGTMLALAHHARGLGDAPFPQSLSDAFDEVLKPASARQPRLRKLVQSQTTMPKKGFGCGAAMRSMPIGLAYSGEENRAKLLAAAIESARVTHNTATGIYGSVATALMTAFALENIPPKEWGIRMSGLRQEIQTAMEPYGHTKAELRYALNHWKWFLKERNIQKETSSDPCFTAPERQVKRYTNGSSIASVPVTMSGTDPAQLFAYWGGFAYQPNPWPGSSGHDAPLIAYDALLAAHHVMRERNTDDPSYYQDLWKELCLRAAAHSGDSDSTMVIAGALYGVMYGTKGVPNNYLKAEPAMLENMKLLGDRLYTSYGKTKV